MNIHQGQADVGIANNPDTENRWPSATPAKLERAYSVSAILKEIEALKMKIVTYLLLPFFSSTAVLSDSHDAFSTAVLFRKTGQKFACVYRKPGE